MIYPLATIFAADGELLVKVVEFCFDHAPVGHNCCNFELPASGGLGGQMAAVQQLAIVGVAVHRPSREDGASLSAGVEREKEWMAGVRRDQKL